MSEQPSLRGCPTFEQGLGLVADQQALSAMDPNVLQAQITVPLHALA